MGVVLKREQVGCGSMPLAFRCTVIASMYPCGARTGGGRFWNGKADLKSRIVGYRGNFADGLRVAVGQQDWAPPVLTSANEIIVISLETHQQKDPDLTRSGRWWIPRSIEVSR